MTENKIKPTMEQTIYCLKAESERYPEVCEECQLYGEVGCDHCYDDTNDMAIKFLKELEQYRAIGTVEHIQLTFELCKVLDAMTKMYEAIGTIDEFKALKEKSVAKKPLCVSMAKDKDKNVGNVGRCPCCNDIVAEDMLWCDECGQKLDWQ